MRVLPKPCSVAIRSFLYQGFRGLTANPYNGCGHRCVYCYATFEWFPNFYDELHVKHNFPQVLSRQLIENRVGQPVFLSSATDPYQPHEQSFKITRKAVELLQRHGIPYYIFTKSAGVVRDLELHASYKGSMIVWSLTTINEKVKRLIEPYTSPARSVLKVMREFAEAGVPVGANIDPVIPGLTDLDGWVEEVVDAVAESGGSFVSVGALRLRDDIWAKMNNLLQSRGMSDIADMLKKLYKMDGSPGYREPPHTYEEQLIQRVARRARRAGLTFGIPLPTMNKPRNTLIQTQLSSYLEESFMSSEAII